MQNSWTIYFKNHDRFSLRTYMSLMVKMIISLKKTLRLVAANIFYDILMADDTKNTD